MPEHRRGEKKKMHGVDLVDCETDHFIFGNSSS